MAINSGKKKPKKKKATRSPVKIPTVGSIDNEIEDEIEEVKDNRKDLYSYKKEKKEKEEEEKKEKEEEEKKEKEEEEENLKAPHTPTRFKIETPRTPKRKFNELPDVSSKLNLYDRLKDKRYTLLKYIISEEEDKLIYVVCYDPNGQILFVKIDESINKNNISLEEKNIINIKRKYDDIFPDAFQNAIQERMTIEIQGVVFYDGINYLFALHHRNGTIENYKYEIVNYQDNSVLVICETYTVVNLKEIEKESGVILDITKKNYQLIQQQQQLISKNTSDNIITSVNNLSNTLKNFNQLNKKYINNIIDDWGFLGTCSAEYYEKYGEGKLTEEEKEKFDKISVNMFARFKAFNEQLMLVNQLNKIIPDIDKSAQLINKICEEIEYNDARMSDKIIEVEDINL